MPTLNDGFRVFTQEETRLVRATAKLFDFEERHVEAAAQVTFTRHTVPVYEGSTARWIGSASLFVLHDTVMAYISFDYSTPERLDLDVQIPVYAIPVGDYYLMRASQYYRCAEKPDGHNCQACAENRWVCDFVDVKAVELHTTPPTWVRSGIGGPLSLFRAQEEK